MEEREIIEKLKEENKAYVPDLRNKIVTRAKADGLLQLEEAQSEILNNGRTKVMRKSKGWFITKLMVIGLLAIIAAASLVIGLLGRKSNGGPGSEGGKGEDTVPVIKSHGDEYSVGAVATAKLIYEFFGEPQEQSKTAKSRSLAAARSDESGIENFGVYFSAFDSFFADDMLATFYSPLEKNEFDNEAVIYGKYADGRGAEFRMLYNEATDLDTSTDTVINLYLTGYIHLNATGIYPIAGNRTVEIVGGKEVQTALEICAYTDISNKSNYAKMELTDDGFKFTVVIEDVAVSEALMYRPAGSAGLAYVVDIAGEDGGTFTVGVPADGCEEVTVDYVNGDKSGQFYKKTSSKDNKFVLCDYLVYKLSSDSSYWTVTGSNQDKFPEDGVMVIPAYVGGKPVKAIEDYAFYNHDYITSVKMPNTIEEVRVQAFGDCDNIADIAFSSELKSVGHYAFKECKGNSELKLGAKLSSVGAGAFSGWEDLQTITLDPANTSLKLVNDCLIIGKTIYLGCAKSVIPADGSVNYIYQYAFLNSKIRSVNIPDAVNNIGREAFSGCSELTQITLPNHEIEIDAYAFDNTAYYNDAKNWDGNLLYIGKHFIAGKRNTTDKNEVVTLKAGTLDVAEEAFASCSFKGVVFNHDVLYIGRGTIYNSYIENLSFDGENQRYVCKNNCLIDIEAKRLIAGGTSAVIPDDGSVTSIGTRALVGNNKNYDYDAAPFVVPASVNLLESQAFCSSNFNKIIFNSHITIHEGSRVFEVCQVNEIVFNEGAYIEEQAFVYCNVGTLTFSKDFPVHLSPNAFDNCFNNSIKVHFDGTKQEWMDNFSQEWIHLTKHFIIMCTDATFDNWEHDISD